MLSGYWESVLTTGGILAVGAVGLQITIASGQFSVMHGALMGLGGYAGGWVAKDLGAPFVVTLLVGALAGALVGAMASVFLGRLKGLVLGIATLAVGEGLAIVARNFFPGKAQGFLGIPLRTEFWHVLLVLAVVLLFVTRLRFTRLGGALTAAGADATAAESLGISLRLTKLSGFAIGGAVAGIAGAMNSQYLSLVVPQDLAFGFEVRLLIFVILGGMLSPYGAALGAFVVTVGEELLREVSAFDRQWLLGLVLVIVVMVRPAGIFGRLKIRSHHRLGTPRMSLPDTT